MGADKNIDGCQNSQESKEAKNPMNKYNVTVCVTGSWFLPPAIMWEIHEQDSEEPLAVFAKRLAREGFMVHKTKWIMPGAILAVEGI